MQRCTMVGYPANFRQPLTEAYFRTSGTATRDIPLRWTGPIGRIRVSAGGAGGDITSRSRVLRLGGPGSTSTSTSPTACRACCSRAGNSRGSTWEASLDGEHWVPAEASADGDPQRAPDAEREAVVPLPVLRRIDPDGPPLDTYTIAPGRDVLVDFGETELGSVRFEVRGAGELTIQVGESIAEVQDTTPAFFEQYALDAVPVTAQATRVVLPERAIRFMRVAASQPAELSNVQFDARVWPAEERGRFESSDQDLNHIWRAAVATLKSNMHDFYLDGIRRDGLVWHDGPLTLDAYERVFFDADLSRQTLVAETLPERPGVRDVGIIDAPMYTIMGFERELLVRGDPSFSRLFRDRIEDILTFYASLQDEHGFVDARRVEPYGYFPDWSATEATGPIPMGHLPMVRSCSRRCSPQANAWRRRGRTKPPLHDGASPPRALSPPFAPRSGRESRGCMSTGSTGQVDSTRGTRRSRRRSRSPSTSPRPMNGQASSGSSTIPNLDHLISA